MSAQATATSFACLVLNVEDLVPNAPGASPASLVSMLHSFFFFVNDTLRHVS
jgi:hypothetical protein